MILKRKLPFRQRGVGHVENKPDLSRKINLFGCRYFFIEMRIVLGTRKQSESKNGVRWVVTVFGVTIFVSALFSLLSSLVFESAGLVVAFLVLFLIVVIGILFDMIGVAVTAADETPFHAMASRRVPEASEAIRLLRNAARVGSICNDVIGDICGVVSGSAAAVIAASVVAATGISWVTAVSVLLSALVAAMTVGGKAAGKNFAIRNSTQIVQITARLIYAVKHFPQMLFRRKKKR